MAIQTQTPKVIINGIAEQSSPHMWSPPHIVSQKLSSGEVRNVICWWWNQLLSVQAWVKLMPVRHTCEDNVKNTESLDWWGSRFSNRQGEHSQPRRSSFQLWSDISTQLTSPHPLILPCVDSFSQRLWCSWLPRKMPRSGWQTDECRTGKSNFNSSREMIIRSWQYPWEKNNWPNLYNSSIIHHPTILRLTFLTTSQRFNPTFPGTCPFVTIVGATQIKPGNTVKDPEEALSNTFVSGGGFSNVFEMPSYQTAHLKTYWDQHHPAYSASQFNNSKLTRGYPDLSANGAN